MVTAATQKLARVLLPFVWSGSKCLTASVCPATRNTIPSVWIESERSLVLLHTIDTGKSRLTDSSRGHSETTGALIFVPAVYKTVVLASLVNLCSFYILLIIPILCALMACRNIDASNEGRIEMFWNEDGKLSILLCNISYRNPESLFTIASTNWSRNIILDPQPNSELGLMMIATATFRIWLF